MTTAQATNNLKKFFRAAVNTTTRERIFFSRLSFDLKIAAARAGYHLHLYEPDVDRDGFDIVVEDDDSTRQVQTKAVLSGVPTNSWRITAGLIRASAEDQDVYQISPVESGRGGGVVLIEIDASTDDGNVIYSYTDYEILVAIAEGYLLETPPAKRKRGKAATPARQEAAEVLEQVWRVDRHEKVALSRRLFVRLKTSDQLLALIGMGSIWNGFARFAVKAAYAGRVEVDADGKLAPGADIQHVAILWSHIQALVDAQSPDAGSTKGAFFKTFEWDRAPAPSDLNPQKP